MGSSLAAVGLLIGALVLGLLVGWALNILVRDGHWAHTETHGLHEHRARPWLIKTLSALGFAVAYLSLGITWRLLLAWVFIAIMIAVGFIDLEHMIIPNRIVLPATLVCLAASIALRPSGWWIYLVAALGGAFFLFILALAWRGGMGAGDVKLALLMGAVLGALVIVAMFLAFILGAVVGLVLLATKRKTRKDAIPFGPYLALASVVALLAGDWLVDSYLSLMG